MPTLKQLTCQIEFGEKNIKLSEYATKYGDGVVVTHIAVPTTAQNFSIHLTSQGYIAPGLAMFVFMDGVSQCNRNRRNLVIPDKNTESHQYEIDLRVRQKEDKFDDKAFISREWRFADLQTIPVSSNSSTKVSNDMIRGVGNIEVVVLRCHEDKVIRANYARSAIDDGRGINLDGASDWPDEVYFGISKDQNPDQCRSNTIRHLTSTPHEAVVERKSSLRNKTVETKPKGPQFKLAPNHPFGLDGSHDDENRDFHRHDRARQNYDRLPTTNVPFNYPYPLPYMSWQYPGPAVGYPGQRLPSNYPMQHDQQMWPAHGYAMPYTHHVGDYNRRDSLKEVDENNWPIRRTRSQRSSDKASRSERSTSRPNDHQDEHENNNDAVDNENTHNWNNERNDYQNNNNQDGNISGAQNNIARVGMDGNWDTGDDNNNPGEGWPRRGSGRTRSRTSVSQTSRSEIQIGADHFDPTKPYFKPYWTKWPGRKSSKAENAMESSKSVFFLPEEPQSPVPEDVAEINKLSHQIKVGAGKMYAHPTATPKYIDSMEKPYAVFVFKYRSKGETTSADIPCLIHPEKFGIPECLETMFPNLKIREDREPFRDRIRDVPREELVEMLMKAKEKAGYDTDSSLDQTSDHSANGSDVGTHAGSRKSNKPKRQEKIERVRRRKDRGNKAENQQSGWVQDADGTNPWVDPNAGAGNTDQQPGWGSTNAGGTNPWNPNAAADNAPAGNW